MSRFLDLIRRRPPKVALARGVNLLPGVGVPSRHPRLTVFVAIAAVLVSVAAGTAAYLEREHLAGVRPDPANAADLTTARARAIMLARDRHVKRANELSAAVARTTPAVFRERTADTTHAEALFASHSWYVPPPPPPPVPPPPPPPPSAPPFPYTFVGSYAPLGQQPVYFLARGDRVTDAHVGDRLDGVYEFESAGPGGLTFNYLPLNIRQTVPTGGSP